MMEFKGKYLETREITPYIGQLVFEKQYNRKKEIVALKVFGYWYQLAKNMKLRKGDRLIGTVIIRSKLVNGKYMTDFGFVKFEKVVKEKPKQEGTVEIPYIPIVDENGNTLL